MAALSHTKTKDASTPNDESLLQKAARIIPGMGSSGGAPTKKPTRSRKAKMASISAPVQGTGVTIGKEGEPSSLAPPAQGAGQGAEEEGDELVEAKKTSAVEATSKRIRAANKKLVSTLLARTLISVHDGRASRRGAEGSHARLSWM